MSAISTASGISLTGSAQIIAEYLKYSVNAILYQRGVLPADDFDKVTDYGLVFFMSRSRRNHIQNSLADVEVWLQQNLVKKFSLYLENVQTKQKIECWDFVVKTEAALECAYYFAGVRSNKCVTEVRKEIANVMRQILSTGSFLPRLTKSTKYGMQVTFKGAAPHMPGWRRSSPIHIRNAQEPVLFREFSTGLQNVRTSVRYQIIDPDSD